MENNRIINAILMTVGILLVSPFFVYAYDDKTTHPALTNETVKFFNNKYPELQLADKDKSILTKGSIDEDKGARALHHFYDPIYNRGITMFGIEWQKSKEWTKDTLSQASYSFDVVSNPTERIFYGTVREFFGADSDYSWERAIYEYTWGDRKRGLESLGHVLHLIQDSSVPDHTRNDPHPPAFHFGSPYEKWTDQFDINTINVFDKVKNKDTILYKTLDDYFDSIANYSNNNFFSKDTIFSEEYENPKITDDIIWKKLSDGQFYQFIENKEGGLLLLTGSRRFGSVQPEKTIEDKDRLILSDYWNLLSQQAVLHGAGVVKLFFDEAEKEKQTKILYNKNKNWFQKIFDFTQKSIYNTATAFYGGSVPYGELADDST
ncbi:MAG: hypothetical protein Q8R36_02970, partial [bacterium]|nr:hypothetical protein [bacterium]